MKSKFSLLFAIAVIFSSCQEDIEYTGNLVVTAGDVTEYSGTPIHEIAVGVYDIRAYGYTSPLYQKTFIGGKVKFGNINADNYIVAMVGSPYTQAVQVRVGRTTTVNIFD